MSLLSSLVTNTLRFPGKQKCHYEYSGKWKQKFREQSVISTQIKNKNTQKYKKKKGFIVSLNSKNETVFASGNDRKIILLYFKYYGRINSFLQWNFFFWSITAYVTCFPIWEQSVHYKTSKTPVEECQF